MESHLQSCQVRLDALHNEHPCTMPPVWLFVLLLQYMQRSGPNTDLDLLLLGKKSSVRETKTQMMRNDELFALFFHLPHRLHY